jgi:hypothetical protein
MLRPNGQAQSIRSMRSEPDELVAAIRAWELDLTKLPRRKRPTLSWKCAELLGDVSATQVQRNLKCGGTLGAIANACGVSVDTLRRFLSGQHKREEQRRRIREGLKSWGRLPDGSAHTALIPPAPNVTPHRALRDRLDELSRKVSLWTGLTDNAAQGSAARQRPPYEHELERLVCEASLSGALEIAHAATIVLAQHIQRMGLYANNDGIGWRAVARLNDVVRVCSEPGLSAAARWTQARLIRELLVSVESDRERCHWLRQAAQLMSSIRDEVPLAMPITLPGVRSEIDRARPDVVTTQSGPDWFVCAVPVPRRLQAAFLVDAAYAEVRSPGAGTDSARALLADAERTAYAGLALQWTEALPKRRLQTAVGLVQCVRLVATREQDAGREPLHAQTLSLLRKVDGLLEALAPALASDDCDALSSYAMLTLQKATMESASGRIPASVLDTALACIARCHRLRPRMKSITFQEFLYQHHLVNSPDRDIRKAFTKACGFTAAEEAHFEQSILPGSRQVPLGPR